MDCAFMRQYSTKHDWIYFAVKGVLCDISSKTLQTPKTNFENQIFNYRVNNSFGITNLIRV